VADRRREEVGRAVFNEIKQYRRIGNALRPRQSHEDAGHKRQDRYNYPQMDKDRSELLVR